MASIVANLPLPILVNGRLQSFHKNPSKITLPASGERNHSFSIVTKATSESSESSASLSLVKSVQSAWDQPEDRLALIGLGFAAVVAFWASSNFVTAIDKLPVIPSTFEFIGILYSSWFTYRYLLFRPDREELLKNINKSISDILGQ